MHASQDLNLLAQRHIAAAATPAMHNRESTIFYDRVCTMVVVYYLLGGCVLSCYRAVWSVDVWSCGHGRWSCVSRVCGCVVKVVQ